MAVAILNYIMIILQLGRFICVEVGRRKNVFNYIMYQFRIDILNASSWI